MVAVGAYFLVGRKDKVLTSSVNFVCVATGKTFDIDRNKVNYLPWKNPSTGEKTLLPCVKRDGKLFVTEHTGRLLSEDEYLRKVNKHVDPRTLEVRPQP